MPARSPTPQTFAGLLLATLSLTAGAAAFARISTPSSFADAKTRNIVGGRKVLVVVPQTRISASFLDLSYLGPGAGPVLIGGQTPHEVNQLIAPLVDALAGYDFDGPLYAGLLPTVNASSWLRAQDPELTHLTDDAGIERELNESNTRQMLLLRCIYFVDYHQQRIIVELQASILVRKIPKGQHGYVRLKPEYIPFQQIFRSISYLPQSEGAQPEANVARWAADHGKLARRALDRGIARVTALLAANLDADEDTIAKWRHRGDRKTVERYGVQGWVVGHEANGVQFVQARTGTFDDVETVALN